MADLERKREECEGCTWLDTRCCAKSWEAAKTQLRLLHEKGHVIMQLEVSLELNIEREVSSTWESRIRSRKVGAECAGLPAWCPLCTDLAWAPGDWVLPSNRIHPTTFGRCCQTQHSGRLTGALRKRPCPTFSVYTAFFAPFTPLLIPRTIQCIAISFFDIEFGSRIAAKTTLPGALVQIATLRVVARHEPVCGRSALKETTIQQYAPRLYIRRPLSLSLSLLSQF